MRKMLGCLLVIALLFCFAGCADEPATTTMGTSTTATTVTTESAAQTTTTTSAPTTTAKKKKTTTTMTIVTTTACQHTAVSDATCIDGEMCKACGARLSEALGHTFADGICTLCGAKNPDHISRIEVLGVKLEEDVVELLVGDTVQLTYTLSPENATDQNVTWTSSNPAAVTISPNGAVTGVTAGDAVITVTSMNGKTATCKVTVGDMALDMPTLPLEMWYGADYQETVSIYVKLSDVEYRYTQTAENEGTLLILFQGWLTYAADDDGQYTTAKIGWRLYNAEDTLVTEGVAHSSKKLKVGNELVGVSAEIPQLAPGRYRLELYNVFNKN